MNETSLRWKARIGGLRGLSVLVWIGVAVLLIAAGSRAYRALTGPPEPEATTIHSLMAGGARPFRYVSLTGEAYYDIGYTETSDGATVAEYYILLDPETGEAAVVRSRTTSLPVGGPGSVTRTGLVYTSSAELRSAIEADQPFYNQAGVAVDAGWHLAEGERPMGFALALALLLGSAWLGVAAVIPFFFPTVVFAPRPPTALAATASPQLPGQGVHVTGRFQQLKRLHPALEPGRRWQRFTYAVANLVMLDDGRLMIYIHHIVRTQLYGVVTVSKRESDWAVFVGKSEPWEIEPGAIYGWRDRPAVRFRRLGPGKKMAEVYVIFGLPDQQAEFAKALRTAGFAVGMGVMA